MSRALIRFRCCQGSTSKALHVLGPFCTSQSHSHLVAIYARSLQSAVKAQARHRMHPHALKALSERFIQEAQLFARSLCSSTRFLQVMSIAIPSMDATPSRNIATFRSARSPFSFSQRRGAPAPFQLLRQAALPSI